MTDVTLSSMSGSSGLLRLAPDLTYPANKGSGVITPVLITGISVTAGVKGTTLSLAGKFAVSLLKYANLVAEPMTHKLTIDGVVIWNDDGSSGTSETLLGGMNNVAADTSVVSETVLVESSLLLEITTTTDTSVDLYYQARPIL